MRRDASAMLAPPAIIAAAVVVSARRFRNATTPLFLYIPIMALSCFLLAL
jgi:hypothetical protein